MEFIMENYIWFIIGGIVILMTIIGYIADKTNFTKREENREKIKHSKKKKIEELEEIIEEEPVQETHEINPIEDFNMEGFEPAFDTDEIVAEETSINEPIVMEDPVAEKIKDINEEEMFDMNIDGEVEETVEEPTEMDKDLEVEPQEIAEEDLYVGLDGTPNAYKEDEEIEEQDENLEIELPSISSLDSELKEETDEDDVWKF